MQKIKFNNSRTIDWQATVRQLSNTELQQLGKSNEYYKGSSWARGELVYREYWEHDKRFLALSNRTRNALLKAKVRSIAQVITRGKAWLLSQPCIGKATWREMLAAFPELNENVSNKQTERKMNYTNIRNEYIQNEYKITTARMENGSLMLNVIDTDTTHNTIEHDLTLPLRHKDVAIRAAAQSILVGICHINGKLTLNFDKLAKELVGCVMHEYNIILAKGLEYITPLAYPRMPKQAK